MGRYLELMVARRGLDPVAWTALHALLEMGLADEPVALGRADLWEFELPPGTEADALVRWAASANWFANPSRDLVHWRRRGGDRDGLPQSAVRADGELGEVRAGAYLVVAWTEGLRAPDHERAARRRLGCEVVVRQGHVWWLATAQGRSSECLAAIIDHGRGGLLLNPNSQCARIYEGALPLPVLPEVGAEAHTMKIAGGKR